jgi:hypothetical protein
MDPERMAKTLDRFLLALSFILLVHERRDLPIIFPGLDISRQETDLVKFSLIKLGVGIAVF